MKKICLLLLAFMLLPLYATPLFAGTPHNPAAENVQNASVNAGGKILNFNLPPAYHSSGDLFAADFDLAKAVMAESGLNLYRYYVSASDYQTRLKSAGSRVNEYIIVCGPYDDNRNISTHVYNTRRQEVDEAMSKISGSMDTVNKLFQDRLEGIVTMGSITILEQLPLNSAHTVAYLGVSAGRVNKPGGGTEDIMQAFTFTYTFAENRTLYISHYRSINSTKEVEAFKADTMKFIGNLNLRLAD
ncbi:hypothetical protein LJB93_02640 [Desulfovibrio sp. OttesenSCG-928-F07]|nr:hypothetical protein [Desulfovibrio sp. OttesenSCG-928-F07]